MPQISLLLRGKAGVKDAFIANLMKDKNKKYI